MRTIIGLFLSSLIISLILTPLVARMATQLNLVDIPSGRKVHHNPIPFMGGVVIYIAFFAAFLTCVFYRTNVLDLIFADERIFYLVFGASVVFIMGLVDDVKKLSPGIKFFIQVLAALIAFYGGIRIEILGLPGMPLWHLEWLSLPATILWVLIVINAINLIDGLDGLAAGVSFFVCIILLMLCLLGERLLVATILAALTGSILGFLRYNFNPASIFMGNSGSYFLGYMIAALGMLGSIKGQTAVTILMPMIALGFPLMDTIWATIRRFILGKNLFHPDKDHFHHRLMEKGYTHRRAVILLYGFTVLMGLISIFMVSVHDKRSAVILLLVAVGMVVSIRRLGYLDYVVGGKLVSWGVDILDQLGFSRNRREFFARQVDLAGSKDIQELWREAISAVRHIGIDYVEMRLSGAGSKNEKRFCWSLKEENKDYEILHSDKRLHLRFPLEKAGRFFGALTVSKDMEENGNGSDKTFNRIEHFRRTLSDKLYEMTDDQGVLLPAYEPDDMDSGN